MYYLRELEDKVRLPPSAFGSLIEEALLRFIRDKYERRIFRDMGVVLSAGHLKVSSDGIVIPGDSGAYYTVQFQLLTFLPKVNEIFEGDVQEVVEFGAFVRMGPFQGLLHVSQISKNRFFYDKKSKSLINRTEKKSLKKGDHLLFKVSTVSLKSPTPETKIGLTMRPEGLGKLEWLEEQAAKERGIRTKKAKDEKGEADKNGKKEAEKKEKTAKKKEDHA